MTTDTTNDITEATETTETPMRVLKRAETSSLSNRSTLGYAIGCDESDAIHFSLRSNTAAGMFSKNWIPYADIADALLRADKITSNTLLTTHPSRLLSLSTPRYMFRNLSKDGASMSGRWATPLFFSIGNHMNTIISRCLVLEAELMDTVDRLFGINYVLKLEPAVFQFAEHLAENYGYGYWEFYTLSNGGFYMAPRSDTVYPGSSVVCPKPRRSPMKSTIFALEIAML